jgi:hypothetical protein
MFVEMEKIMNKELNAFVTKSLVEEKKRINFMYREEPDNSQDSGWRFFSGDETQEYVDNASNVLQYTIENVINQIDSGIEGYLNSEAGSAFERKNGESEFTKVENFKFGENLK